MTVDTCAACGDPIEGVPMPVLDEGGGTATVHGTCFLKAVPMSVLEDDDDDEGGEEP